MFLPERQTGRGSLLTHEFLHAAGPATLAAGAQGADPLGRSTGLHLRLAPHRGGDFSSCTLVFPRTRLW